MSGLRNEAWESPAPANISRLKLFLGVVNYYGKFLHDLSTHLALLYALGVPLVGVLVQQYNLHFTYRRARYKLKLFILVVLSAF